MTLKRASCSSTGSTEDTLSAGGPIDARASALSAAETEILGAEEGVLLTDGPIGGEANDDRSDEETAAVYPDANASPTSRRTDSLQRGSVEPQPCPQPRELPADGATPTPRGSASSTPASTSRSYLLGSRSSSDRSLV